MLVDWDNDGLADAFVPNGFLTGRLTSDLESFFWRCVVMASPDAAPATKAYKQAWIGISHMSQVEGLSWNGRERDFAYWNVGGGSFADVSAAAGLDYEDDGRVVLITDWDGDGRLDLWIKNRTAPVLRFVRNVHSAGAWIAFELEGVGGNREAVGALVRVEAGERVQARRVYAGEGYLGGSTRRLHFGLGDAECAERVVVRWPDGTEHEHTDVDVNALYRLSKADGSLARCELPARSPLEGVLPERIPPTDGARIARVALLDRLPSSTLELPRFDGTTTSVAEFSGSALLLVVWASWDDAAIESLAGLARERDQLAAAGVTLFPLTLDGVRDEPYARQALARAGFPDSGGRAGTLLKKLLEITTYEALGPYDDLPLPLGLLFDGRGALCVLYVGAIDPETVARDAPRIEAGQGRPGARWPIALTGGHWRSGRGPARDLENLAKFFHRNGLDVRGAEIDRAIERRKQEAGD
ncbi:MAG: hypothetical protein E2O39_09195 [Planctomycetota bacterium]|nr:MAG: hypothetical protein E2O39_09195 [Planctomycetota bacterium]